MNHDQATQQQATERYILGELSDDQRDAFEEHYFDCALCADNVRAASAFTGAVRASARNASNPFLERQKAKQRRRFVAPLAAAASLIVGVLTMQVAFVAPLQTEVATLRQPFAPQEVRVEDLRGARATAESSQPIQLEIEIPTDLGPAPYTCAVLDAKGSPQAEFKVTEERAKDYFPITYRPGGLKPGDYTIRVSDANRKVIKEYPIEVR